MSALELELAGGDVVAGETRCRRCGCTDQRACTTPYGPCYWVEQDLCSGCAPKGPMAHHRICAGCWNALQGFRVPVRVQGGDAAPCCFCGELTTAGIHLRGPRRAAPACSCGGAGG